MNAEALREACRKIKHVALDMDGTIYMGSNLFPFTHDFLKLLRDNGIGYSFLTNNPTRSIKDYLAKLQKMGVEASEENMYTTAVATIDYLKANMPEARRLFVVGTPSMKAEFERAGFELTRPSADDMPDALVVAFDTTLEYERLCHASWLAAEGLPYIATNPDRVCPTNLSTILVDCGSLCACIEHATGRTPDEIAMCGDRIYTDVAMANNAGALGVLVLSGETTLDTALNSDPQPPITAKNIMEFGKLLIDSKK